MNQTSGTDERVSEAVEEYGNMIRRICFVSLKNRADVDDIFQEVFLKYLLHSDPFESKEHEKAWLCRVAFNQCKDFHKSFWQRKVGSIEEMEIPYESPEQSELISAVLALPPKWKEIIYLHFYEGMTIPQIAALQNRNQNSVYTDLRRAKVSLKGRLEEELTHGNL